MARRATSTAKRRSAVIFSPIRTALAEKQHLICYAVKANSNIAVLQTLAELGAGFDIVSSGELERVLRAGGDPAKVVFSGVAKTADEMRRALELGIHCFNVESEAELELLNSTAAACDLTADISCGSIRMWMHRLIPIFRPA